MINTKANIYTSPPLEMLLLPNTDNTRRSLSNFIKSVYYLMNGYKDPHYPKGGPTPQLYYDRLTKAAKTALGKDQILGEDPEKVCWSYVLEKIDVSNPDKVDWKRTNGGAWSRTLVFN